MNLIQTEERLLQQTSSLAQRRQLSLAFEIKNKSLLNPPTHFKKHKSSKTTYIPKVGDLLKCFTGFMLHFLETPVRLLMLKQKEDEGDLEEEAWSANWLADTRRHCTIPEPNLAAPQPPEEGGLRQFERFSKLSAAYAKFRRGQASAYRTMLCCNAGNVLLWGEKTPISSPHHIPSAHSSHRRFVWTGMALLGGKQRGSEAAERA